MTQRQVTIDFARLDAAYKQAVNQHASEAQRDSEQMLQSMGQQGQQMRASLGGILGGVSSTVGTFCDEWNTNKATITNSLSRLTWVPFIGPWIARALAAISALDSTVIPIICGAAGAVSAGAGAAPTTTTPQGQGTR
jgi:hypothetical protein